MISQAEANALLEKLSNASAPSGFEDEVLEIARDFCADFADMEVNSLRDGFIRFKHSKAPDDAPCIMLDAHADEVGGMVSAVKQSGVLKFAQLGGFSRQALPGQIVRIRNVEGTWMRATIGVKPPHFQTAAEKSGAQAVDLILDVGASSAEEVREVFGIDVGCPFVPDTSYSYYEKANVAYGKAFDCRAGVCAMLLAMRELAQKDINVQVVASISSQEELGDRGVAAAVRHVQPDLAYVFEGCPADDTFTPQDEIGAALHKGPMFRLFDRCMLTNPRYQAWVLDVARTHNIACQPAVREGGGTNAGMIHQYDVPSVVSSVACRYIHSGMSLCALDDVVASANLAVEVICSLDSEIIKGF